VGIIMDGNGRWAEALGRPRLDGHRAGADSVRDITRASRELGLEAITLYAFSSQNWARPAEEVAGLMQLLREFLLGERSEILDNQIRLEAIGDIDKLPPMVKEPLDELRAASAHHRAMTLTLALSYGGRSEILEAVKRMAADGLPDDLREEHLAAHLDTAGLPDPDLIVRTSGEQRTSNFLLWQAAYAELYFTDVLWPDFDEKQLLLALRDYQGRQRRFGLTGDQVGPDHRLVALSSRATR